METEQLALFDVPPSPKKQPDKNKRNWEDGFQRWSNKQFTDHEYDQPLGCCGWGSMCNYCADNTYGRPCVRALNEMYTAGRMKKKRAGRSADHPRAGAMWRR